MREIKKVTSTSKNLYAELQTNSVVLTKEPEIY